MPVEVDDVDILSGLEQAQANANSSFATANASIITANAALTVAGAAQSTADTAISNAATAQGSADAAQSTADTAISNAATAQALAQLARDNETIDYGLHIVNYALVPGDSGTPILCSCTSIVNVIVPLNTLSPGFRCKVISINTGSVAIVAAAGVTLNGTSGNTVTINGIWRSAEVIMYATNVVAVSGQLL